MVRERLPYLHTRPSVLTPFARLILGIIIVLFFQSVAALLNPARRRGERIKWGLVSYTALMFSVVTIFYALSVSIQSLSFIDHRGFPGVEGMPFVGPVGYQSFLESGAPGLAINLMWCLNSWLADGFLASPPFDVAFTHLGV